MPSGILISKYETASFHESLVPAGIHTTVSPPRSFYFWGAGCEECADFHPISPFSPAEPLKVWGVEPPWSCASHFSPEGHSLPHYCWWTNHPPIPVALVGPIFETQRFLVQRIMQKKAFTSLLLHRASRVRHNSLFLFWSDGDGNNTE